MLESISSRWWLFLLRGLAGVIVAVVCFTQPAAALVGLTLVLGFYSFIIGVLAVVGASMGAAGNRWWALLLEGILGVVLAVLIWSWPLQSTVAFVYFVAAWLITSGIIQVVAGLALSQVVKGEWLYILSGVISTVFGMYVFRSPQQGAIATAFLFGWYFLFFGMLQVAFAFRIRAFNREIIGPAVKL